MKIDYISCPNEVVTVEEAKTQLRLDGTDHDTYIEGLITASRRVCESYLKRAIPTQTQRLSLDGFPCEPIRLPNPPLQSVSSVQYKTDDGWQTWSSDSYTVLSGIPGYVLPNYGSLFPTPLCEPESVRITYVCGENDPPQTIKQAILVLTNLLYEDPNGCSEMPNGVKWLLDSEGYGIYV